MTDQVLARLWKIIPTTLAALILVALAILSISSGALEAHGGRVVVIALIGLAVLPTVLSLGELAPSTRTR